VRQPVLGREFSEQIPKSRDELKQLFEDALRGSRERAKQL
jgi:hypothetical protein